MEPNGLFMARNRPAKVGWPHLCLATAFTMLAAIAMASLPSTQPAFAQGCGMGGHSGEHSSAHSSSHAHTAEQPSLSRIWSNILHSHVGLRRSVSVMSVPDAVLYGGLMRDDFKALKNGARVAAPGMEESLNAAEDRVDKLTKRIPKDVKGNDQTAASDALAQLDIELRRVVAIFPADAVPEDVGSKFLTPDSLRSDTGSEVAGTVVSKPTVEYACPMHPEVTSAGPGKCPRCGMALEKVNH